MRATILRLDAEMHKQLRIAAIEADMSMNDAINQAVALWLKEQKEPERGARNEAEQTRRRQRLLRGRIYSIAYSNNGKKVCESSG